MLDVRSCPPSAPRVDSLVLWRTEILFSSDFSASSPSRLTPELSRSLSRPSTLLQTGLLSSDRRCARDYQGFCLRIEFVLNTGFILRLPEWLKICLMFEQLVQCFWPQLNSIRLKLLTSLFFQFSIGLNKSKMYMF